VSRIFAECLISICSCGTIELNRKENWMSDSAPRRAHGILTTVLEEFGEYGLPTRVHPGVDGEIVLAWEERQCYSGMRPDSVRVTVWPSGFWEDDDGTCLNCLLVRGRGMFPMEMLVTEKEALAAIREFLFYAPVIWQEKGGRRE
jgi:hypothetical protein